MKPLVSSLMCLALVGAAGALHAQTPPPQVPPPPPSVVAPNAPGGPGMRDGFVPPRGMSFMAPVGNQARLTYLTLSTNKDNLNLSADQVQKVEDIWKKSDQERQKRSTEMQSLSRDLQQLAESDNPDMAQVEAKVRALQKARGDDMLADIRTNIAMRNVLTPEQRTQLKTMGPRFPGMEMPGMRGMPGMPGMPGAPGAPVPPGGMPPPPPPPPLPAPPPAPPAPGA